MNKLAGFFCKVLERQKACMAACVAVSLVSGSICAATVFDAPLGVRDMDFPASTANVSQVQAAEPETAVPVEDGSIPDDDCTYVFYSAWEGWEFKPSEISSEYEVGDEIKITVTYNRSVGSQIASNVDGTWTTFAADGKTLEAVFIPDDDWLNLQITDLKEATSVGVVSIDIEITLKNAAKLARMNYTSEGDHLLFSGGVEEAYETDDLWLSYCDDTDWLTLIYDCTMSGQEGWGILGWGGSLDGEWINGPGYGADKKDSTEEVTVNFTVKYLRRMMHLSKNDELDFTSLGAWSGGRIKSLILHRGSLMPRNDVLFENGTDNEEWVCKDIEQLLDEDGSRFLCLKYTCSNEENYGWSVMGFGAGVDGEWKSGRTFKVSEYQPDRIHYDFMTMDQFRSSMGLSWDVKVDSISLGAYNQGRILKLWLSDTPALDPGDDVTFEDEWESPNAKIYERVAEAQGTNYPQNIRLQESWSQARPEGEQEMIESIGRNAFLVVSYESEGRETPTLYMEMKDGKQSHVKAVWSDGKRAVYSYDCIAKMFSNYLIPEEVRSLAVSTAEKPMTISEIKIVVDNAELKPEPLAVLTKNWSGFETEISKYHSGYEPGDKVRVTVRFDKEVPSTVAFHLNGKWKSGKLEKEKEFSVTAVPDDDYMSIQIGEIPRTKEYVIIRSISVEIAGKANYTTAVVERGTKNALLAEGALESARAAGLTDEQIKNKKQLIVTTASETVSSQESAQIRSLLEEYADGAESSGYGVSDCVDISLALSDGKSETPIYDTPGEMAFKVPVPAALKGGDYDFAVARIHKGVVNLLPDVDDEISTITFRSNQFSRFAVVFGPKDCFKELRGDTSIHTFTSAWNGWGFCLNDYLEGDEGFGIGDEVKVTVTFDKETSSELHDTAHWDASKQNVENGTTHIYTLTPGGDNLNLQITDMKGEKSVKVLSVKAEITKPAPLPSFAASGTAPVTLNKFLRDFVPEQDRVKVIVKLSADGAFKGKLEGSVKGNEWKESEIFESDSSNQCEFTWTGIPMYGAITLNVTEMSGASNVRVESIKVERVSEEEPGPVEEEPLYTVTQTGQEQKFALKDYNEAYESGKKVKVSVHMKSDDSFSGRLGANAVEGDEQPNAWHQEGFNSTENEAVASWTGTLTGSDGELGLELWSMNGTAVKVLSIEVEILPESEEPGEALHTFTAAWAGYESQFTEYLPGYEAGKPTTVKLKFDKPVKAQIGYNASSGFTNAEGTETALTLEKEVIPADGYMNIQITDMNGNTSVKLLSVEVIQDSQPEESLKVFQEAYSGFETEFSKYFSAFTAGGKTTVKLFFDQEVEAQIGCHEYKDSGWNSVAGDQLGKEITFICIPPDNYMNIQITNMNGQSEVRLLKIEVSQEPVYTFTQGENKDFALKEYWGSYKPQDLVLITVKLSSDQGFGGCLGTNTAEMGGWESIEFNSTESDGVYEAVVEWTRSPSGEDVQLQLWWMSGSSVSIDSITVTPSSASPSVLFDEASDADSSPEKDTKDPSVKDTEPATESFGTPTLDAEETKDAVSGDEAREDDAVLPEDAGLPGEEKETEGEDKEGGNISDKDISEENAQEEDASGEDFEAADSGEYDGKSEETEE